jgi:hypothetical protein
MRKHSFFLTCCLLGIHFSFSGESSSTLKIKEYPIYRDKSGSVPPTIDVFDGLPEPIKEIMATLGKRSEFDITDINTFNPGLEVKPIYVAEGGKSLYSIYLHGVNVVPAAHGIVKWEKKGKNFLLVLEMNESRNLPVTKCIYNYQVMDWDRAIHGDTYPALTKAGLISVDLAHEIQSGNDSVEFAVTKNDSALFRFKTYDPVRGPIRDFFVLNDKWYLQLTNRLFINGKSANTEKGLESIFNTREFANKLFYMAKAKGTRPYRIFLGGKPIGKTYDYVPHDFCCGNSVMNIANGETKIGFFGIRNGMWYLVRLTVLNPSRT